MDYDDQLNKIAKAFVRQFGERPYKSSTIARDRWISGEHINFKHIPLNEFKRRLLVLVSRLEMQNSVLTKSR